MSIGGAMRRERDEHGGALGRGEMVGRYVILERIGSGGMGLLGLRSRSRSPHAPADLESGPDAPYEEATPAP